MQRHRAVDRLRRTRVDAGEGAGDKPVTWVELDRQRLVGGGGNELWRPADPGRGGPCTNPTLDAATLGPGELDAKK